MEINRKEVVTLSAEEIQELIAIGLVAKACDDPQPPHAYKVDLRVQQRSVGIGMSESTEYYVTATATRDIK